MNVVLVCGWPKLRLLLSMPAEVVKRLCLTSAAGSTILMMCALHAQRGSLPAR